MPTIDIENGYVVIRVDEKDIPEFPDPSCLGYSLLSEILEPITCNSEWRLWLPGARMHEYLGALTDGLVLTFEHQEDEHGNITNEGRVFWDRDYEVVDLVDRLLINREVKFVEVK